MSSAMLRSLTSQVTSWRRSILAAVLLMLALSSCSNPFTNSQPPPEPFYPPTRLPGSTPAPQIPTHTPPPPVAPVVIEPAPAEACTDILVFAADLTIPDGTIVQPGEELEKRWQVRNSGTCNWDAGYQVRLTSGPAMGAPEEQALYPARTGTEAKIRMVFTVPEEPGTYRSAWQAADPAGQLFGDPFFIEIVVTGE